MNEFQQVYEDAFKYPPSFKQKALPFYETIASDFEYPKGFRQGVGVIIESDVIVGEETTLGHNVILKSGTRIGNDVVIGDNCCTTGVCLIGNHVRIRTGSTISKGVVVDDWAFIGAGIMSSHTKNISHGRPQMEPRQLVTRIGYGAVVGSRCNLMAGITIAPGVIVGYDSNVTGDLEIPQSLYFGNPARYQQFIRVKWRIELPDDYVPHGFDLDLLEKYLPHVQITKDEFERWYAKRSGTTVDGLHELGRFAEKCECSLEGCLGWQMSHLRGA